jgi:hypothetical protein
VIDVIVTTWGTDAWRDLGVHTAFRNGGHFHHLDSHTVSAGEARNHAVATIDPQEWICFLDADDDLGEHYLERMGRKISHWGFDRNLLLAPALALGPDEPRCLDDRDIIDGWNPCPIGTLVHRSMFDAVGGFWDEEAWEDWSFFRRCVLVGAEIRFVADAVYRASFSRNGRNSTILNPLRLRRAILKSHDDWLAG